MKIKTDGLIDVLGTIVAALPEKAREEVLQKIEWNLVIKEYSNRNADQVGAMELWEFNNLKNNIRRTTEKLDSPCVKEETSGFFI